MSLGLRASKVSELAGLTNQMPSATRVEAVGFPMSDAFSASLRRLRPGSLFLQATRWRPQ
ncbi:uncharacterized protein LY79DRAFT_569596 [Colletotrichum navitas]|uniref:Uncharacterized protein n=1 Tax=Colletotrichum navitas TaxID=681940 RepID=A0AAD8V052_9PEZI|nr:uncharacterized protein LY79DRAFT_569596 [Colletotrichum navitas]KAK1572821.1 hypothetical protein LY79DRAFT_569596 [Colletotrichum navitas]